MYKLTFDGSTIGFKTKKSKYTGAAWVLFHNNKQVAHGITRHPRMLAAHAEYNAVIDGLAYLVMNGYREHHVDICGDCIEIMNNLLIGYDSTDSKTELHAAMVTLLSMLDSYTLKHISRNHNKLADAYSRYAIDYPEAVI